MAIRVWPADAVSGAPSYTGRALRQTQAPFLLGATSSRPLGARTGVRPGTSTTTVSATSTTWTVTPHAGVIDLESAAVAGPYMYAVDANVTGSVTAANATNPRKDIIYAQINDAAEADGTGAGVAPNVAIGYVAGTAAATPAAPATPSRAFVLAYINVPVSGGGSPTVQWVAPYAVSAGGVIPVRSTTERDALATLGTTECPVLVAYNGTLYISTGGAFSVVGGAPTVAAITLDAGYSAQGGYGVPKVEIGADGWVRLIGALVRSAVTASGVTTFPIGTVPAAARPAVRRQVSVPTQLGGARMDINESTGLMSVTYTSSQTITQAVWTCALDGLMYRLADV